MLQDAHKSEVEDSDSISRRKVLGAVATGSTGLTLSQVHGVKAEPASKTVVSDSRLYYSGSLPHDAVTYQLERSPFYQIIGSTAFLMPELSDKKRNKISKADKIINTGEIFESSGEAYGAKQDQLPVRLVSGTTGGKYVPLHQDNPHPSPSVSLRYSGSDIVASSQGHSITVSPQHTTELGLDPISVSIKTRYVSDENPEFKHDIPKWEKGVEEEYRGKEVKLTPVLEIHNYGSVEVKDG